MKKLNPEDQAVVDNHVKGHLRLYLSVNTPLGIKRVRLHTYYNIAPSEETEITRQFRNNNPQLDGTQLQTELCYRVEKHI